MILLARLLAFLGLLLLAPMAQAALGGLSSDHRLLDADALVESLTRKDERTGTDHDDDSGIDGLQAVAGWRVAPGCAAGLPPVAGTYQPTARFQIPQPRAPPFRKA